MVTISMQVYICLKSPHLVPSIKGFAMQYGQQIHRHMFLIQILNKGKFSSKNKRVLLTYKLCFHKDVIIVAFLYLYFKQCFKQTSQNYFPHPAAAWGIETS